MGTNAPRLVAMLDFNAPNARDTLKLQQMASTVSTIFKNFGPDNCILVAWMATQPKEDSEQDPIEDEILIMQALKKAGFGAQQRCRMLLQQPASIESTVHLADWWLDSRLCYLTPNDLTAQGRTAGCQGNFWRMGSEWSRTTHISHRPMLPLPQAMLRVTPATAEEQAGNPEFRLDSSAKAAQRGPHVYHTAMQGLFAKAPVSAAGGLVKSWLQPGDETFILDMTPWVGDRAVASLEFMKPEAAAQQGTVRHFVVDPGYKRMGMGATFTLERVAGDVASQWINRTRILYNKVVDGLNNTTYIPKQPADVVPAPDEHTLRMVPGAYEAWKGLSALEFKVCHVRGPKIAISPEKLAEYQNAPLHISENVKTLETKHLEYEGLLQHMACGEPAPAAEADPRPNVDQPEPSPLADGPPADLITFESEEALKVHAKKTEEVTAMNDKHVTMIKDMVNKVIYFVARQDNHIMPANTVVGGFGGGILADRNLSSVQVIPFILLKGDRSQVQLQTGGEDEGSKVPTKQPKQGTFYSMVKPLERQAAEKGTPLSLTSYGKVVPHGVAGKHGYQFEHEEGTLLHKGQDYIPRTTGQVAGKNTSGNFFQSMANRDGWQGALTPMWRLSHDPVRHIVTARKPFMITARELRLDKGKPMKVCWWPAPAPAAA